MKRGDLSKEELVPGCTLQRKEDPCNICDFRSPHQFLNLDATDWKFRYIIRSTLTQNISRVWLGGGGGGGGVGNRKCFENERCLSTATVCVCECDGCAHLYRLCKRPRLFVRRGVINNLLSLLSWSLAKHWLGPSVPQEWPRGICLPWCGCWHTQTYVSDGVQGGRTSAAGQRRMQPSRDKRPEQISGEQQSGLYRSRQFSSTNTMACCWSVALRPQKPYVY